MKRDLGGFVVVNGEVCHELEPFTGMEDQLRQVVPAELAAPLESLFATLRQIRAVRHSFGKECLHVRVVVEQLEEDSLAVERACKELWREC